MKLKQVKKFAKEQNWEITMIDDNQRLHRFEKDEFIIDFWSGKKGITVGVYNDKVSRYFTEPTDLYIQELFVDPGILEKEKKGRAYKNGKLIK